MKVFKTLVFTVPKDYVWYRWNFRFIFGDFLGRAVWVRGTVWKNDWNHIQKNVPQTEERITKVGISWASVIQFHLMLWWNHPNGSTSALPTILWEEIAGPWWRHQMETFSALLAISAGNSPVTGEFSAQRPVTRSFDVFFDLHPNKRLSKQSWGWWFETPTHSLWRHCNENPMPKWGHATNWGRVTGIIEWGYHHCEYWDVAIWSQTITWNNPDSFPVLPKR